MKKVILVALASIVFVAAAAFWLGGNALPSCALSNGASAIAHLDDAPPALARALVQRVGEVVPAGTKFDATDLLVTGKNRRLIFIWSLNNRWVVATEHGGIGYSDPIFAFEMSQDGREAIFLQERVAYPDSVCSTASRLLSRDSMTTPSRVDALLPGDWAAAEARRKVAP